MNRAKSQETKNKHNSTIHDINYDKIGINAHSKNFKRFSEAGLLNEIDEPFIDEIQKYWKKHYDKNIDPVFHLAFKNFTKKRDPRLIPSQEMWNEIIPFFNDMNIRIGYSDKNIYDTLINPSSTAETVLKRVRGNYFDSDNNNIDTKAAYKLLLIQQEDLIIKPSDSDNGTGIAKLKYKEHSINLGGKNVTIYDLEKLYGFNFTVQKVIKQHSVMANPHPASVNTLRMVTFRWKSEIRHLLTYARFGGNNNVKDHAISGGVSVGVTDTGKLMDFAIDTNCFVHTHHPTTNYSFANNAQIPNYEDFINFVVDLHKNILHHDFVSWDVAVGVDGQPIFIEANFRGTSWRYQLVSQKPLFGELTEEVLQYVSSELKKNKFNRNVKSNVPLIRQRNRRLKIDNKKLTTQNKKLIKENSKISASLEVTKEETIKIKKEYKKILHSRSWRLTLPLRRLGQIYKKLFKKI